MTDNLKFYCDHQPLIRKMQNLPDLKPYKHKFNTYTGFEIAGKLLRIDFRKCFEHGQFIGYSHFELSISPHYHFNDYLHNGNDLTPENARKTIFEILQYLGISESEFEFLKVVNMEYGLNIIPRTGIEKVINGLLFHKKTKFIIPDKDLPFNKITNATKTKRIKAYAKGLMFKDYPVYQIHENTFRFEVKNKKSSAIRKLNITTAKDLFKDEVYLMLSRSILQEWEQVLIIDLHPDLLPLSAEDKNKVLFYSDSRNWLKIINDKNRNKYIREKKKYYNLLNKTHSIRQEITDLLKEKIFSFGIGANLPQRKNIKNTSSDTINKGKTHHQESKTEKSDMVHFYPHAPVVKGNFAPIPRKCVITGIDISHQRKGSIFLREKTLQEIKRTEPKKYSELEKEFLNPKNQNESEERKLYLICKNIRDRESNPRHSRIRFEQRNYPKNQTRLIFPDSEK